MTTERKSKRGYATPTSEILVLSRITENPVTRSVYRDILANRVFNETRAAIKRLQQKGAQA